MSFLEMQPEAKYEKDDPTTSDSCEDMYGGHLMPFVIQSFQVLSEEQYLEIAIHSLPRGLSIRPTAISGGQYGVWSDYFIPKGIKFGPYDINKLNISQQDASTEVECCWFRYVNCAPSKDQMNLLTIENGQKVYYCTAKPIHCDEELLSWNDDISLGNEMIKKEPDFSEVMDTSSEDKDTSKHSGYEEAMTVKTLPAVTSVYQYSERGARDSVWSKEAVRLLVKRYKELDQKLFYRLKDKWKAISMTLQQKGYHLSAEDCDQKWRNLKKTYRLVKYNRENTGKGRLTWEYFDLMHDVLQSEPSNNPVINSTPENKADNTVKDQQPKIEAAICEKPASSQALLPEISIKSDASTNMPQKSDQCSQSETRLWHKKIYSVPPLWFKKLEEERREERKQLFEMLDKMHNDMVNIMETRNNILQKLVDMLEPHK